MADFEKLVAGLQRCTKGGGEYCEGCPYAVEDEQCVDALTHDALAVLLPEGDGPLPAHVERHAMACRQLHELYVRKNRDYGDSFHRTFLEEGMAMSRIRLTDKLSRFKALTKDGAQAQVLDESIRDTLMDLANYAVMTVVEMEREDRA